MQYTSLALGLTMLYAVNCSFRQMMRPYASYIQCNSFLLFISASWAIQ